MRIPLMPKGIPITVAVCLCFAASVLYVALHFGADTIYGVTSDSGVGIGSSSSSSSSREEGVRVVPPPHSRAAATTTTTHFERRIPSSITALSPHVATTTKAKRGLQITTTKQAVDYRGANTFTFPVITAATAATATLVPSASSKKKIKATPVTATTTSSTTTKKKKGSGKNSTPPLRTTFHRDGNISSTLLSAVLKASHLQAVYAQGTSACGGATPPPNVPAILYRACPVFSALAWRRICAFYRYEHAHMRIHVADMEGVGTKLIGRCPKRLDRGRHATRQQAYAVKFAAEIILPHAILRSPLYESNVELATHVIVNACIMGRDQQGAYVNKIWPWMQKSRPDLQTRWSRHDGRDFSIILTGDHGPCPNFYEKTRVDRSNSIKSSDGSRGSGGNIDYGDDGGGGGGGGGGDRTPTHFAPELVNAVFLMNEGSTTHGCYSREKDITIPTSAQIGRTSSGNAAVAANMNEYAIDSKPSQESTSEEQQAKAIAVDGAWSADASAATATGVVREEPKKSSSGCKDYHRHRRKWLVFYSGVDSNSVRDWVHKLFDNDPDFYLPQHLSHNEYLCAMRASIFCLAPRGRAVWSPRLDEAIHAGCIPVLLSENYDAPFSNVLDYGSFSLSLAANQVHNLAAILRAIPASHVAAMRANLERVQPLFRYPDPREPYDEENLLPLLYFQLWDTTRTRLQRAEAQTLARQPAVPA